LIPRHRGKGVQKFVEAVASFEIIDEIPEWDPCADKHGGAAENLRVAVNRFAGREHLSSNILAPRAGGFNVHRVARLEEGVHRVFRNDSATNFSGAA
jgi:hypothetical protein